MFFFSIFFIAFLGKFCSSQWLSQYLNLIKRSQWERRTTLGKKEDNKEIAAVHRDATATITREARPTAAGRGSAALGSGAATGGMEGGGASNAVGAVAGGVTTGEREGGGGTAGGREGGS